MALRSRGLISSLVLSLAIGSGLALRRAPQPKYVPKWPRAAWLTGEISEQFSGRPSKELWEARLRSGIEAARADPCNAAVLITSGPWINGFGAHMQNVVNDVWLAAYDANNSIAICADSPFMAEVWVRLFDNPHNFAVCHSGCKDRLSQTSAGSCEHAADASLSLFQVDKEYMSDLKHFALSTVFQMKGTVLKHINERLDGLDLQAGQYVGVHVRHGDKASEAALQPVKSYASKVKAALRDHGLSTVFLATDDGGVEDELQAELGDAVKVVRQEPERGNAYLWRVGGNLTSQKAKASQMTLLTDITALRQATVFVGTGSSTFGRLVHMLREPSEPAVSLDYPWHLQGA